MEAAMGRFIVVLRLPTDPPDTFGWASSKRIFAGFHRNGVPDWSHTQKVPGNVRLLTFRETKQVIEDLKKWYAEQAT